MQVFQHIERDNIFEIIYRYYDDPVMTKTKNLNQDFSMYACQLPCLLMNEKRYLIAVVGFDTSPVGVQQKLSKLRWNSFQVRSLADESLTNLPTHNYTIKRDDRYQIRLTIQSRTKEISVYSTDIGIFTVSLLHTKNQEYEYPNEGNLISALETFQTVLQWV